MKNITKLILLIFSISYVALTYVLMQLIENKYGYPFPNILGAILFVLFLVCFVYEKNKTHKIFTILSLALFILIQVIALFIPSFYFFINQTFNSF